MTVRFRTFSQAPQAVRSARSRRRDRVFPSGSPANGAFQVDERDPFGLTVQVQWFRDVSCASAIRAVVRRHSLPPSVLLAFSTR
jgi:hypothetical protein